MKRRTFTVKSTEVEVLKANKARIIRTIEKDTATSITVEGGRLGGQGNVVIFGSENGVAAAELKIGCIQEIF